ncbi:hypothetical protein [Nostoc sp. FACHB-133]|uniref:hypothetical protein n=1 Tax=Nostoc sp. FACHB-133 TaxID=2692835 RepID=UPI001684D9DC|nr:hypothetical protein [Nostoc sp. FACHB-133]MBD2526998.1 hypothetical protein [Nostoc sp. FACHB-133]
MNKKILVFITTAIVACISIASLTATIVTWNSWTDSQTSKAVAQKTNSCPGASTKTCLDIDVYEALNLMPRENRPLLNPRLEAQYGGTSSPPNPLVIKSGESVNFFIGPQYFLPASYQENGTKYVPHVGTGTTWPILYPSSTLFTNNKVTFNSGISSNPQTVVKQFSHAGPTDEPPSPASAQYLIASGPITYNNLGEFVATARIQMIRHFWIGCSPSSWLFVPNKNDLCSVGQSQGGHSASNQDKLIDITVSRLIKVVPSITINPNLPINPSFPIKLNP